MPGPDDRNSQTGDDVPEQLRQTLEDPDRREDDDTVIDDDKTPAGALAEKGEPVDAVTSPDNTEVPAPDRVVGVDPAIAEAQKHPTAAQVIATRIGDLEKQRQHALEVGDDEAEQRLHDMIEEAKRTGTDQLNADVPLKLDGSDAAPAADLDAYTSTEQRSGASGPGEGAGGQDGPNGPQSDPVKEPGPDENADDDADEDEDPVTSDRTDDATQRKQVDEAADKIEQENLQVIEDRVRAKLSDASKVLRAIVRGSVGSVVDPDDLKTIKTESVALAMEFVPLGQRGAVHNAAELLRSQNEGGIAAHNVRHGLLELDHETVDAAAIAVCRLNVVEYEAQFSGTDRL